MTQKSLFVTNETPLLKVKGQAEVYPLHRIFCVGRNYMAHATEMGITIDKQQQVPFYFTKNPHHYIASGTAIDYPPQTQNYHHEIELVIAIGKTGFEVSESDASEMIYAYACGLDMTRRDLQMKARDAGLPWDIGKDFAQSAVVSELVLKAEIGEITQGDIRLSINNEVKQAANLNEMIWNVNEIIAHLSKFYTLMPGDLIFTGTPEGVGPVVAGDQIQGVIENVGEISLTINR